MTEHSHSDQSKCDAAELLEQVAEYLRRGAVYMGHRFDGRNDSYQYVSLRLKLPRGGTS